MNKVILLITCFCVVVGLPMVTRGQTWSSDLWTDVVTEQPEGYVVDQLPASATFGTLRNDFTANVSYKLSEDGKSVDVTYTVNDKALYVDPKDYLDYRRFWQQMVKTEKETIVLKRK